MNEEVLNAHNETLMHLHEREMNAQSAEEKAFYNGMKTVCMSLGVWAEKHADELGSVQLTNVLVVLLASAINSYIVSMVEAKGNEHALLKVILEGIEEVGMRDLKADI